MGLFSKKVCDICGGEIGLLGNKKLADGNLCKNCAAKLSPWMTDRRQSTVEEIQRHLMYRAQNMRVLAAMHPTLVLGSRMKVYIDPAAGQFFVTGAANWRERNPDVIPFSQVVDVRTEVTEHRTEEYHRDREGKQVSFNPPRYRFSYEFDTTILVDSPFFNQIQFELTENRPDRVGSQEYRYYEQQADALRQALMGGGGPQGEERPANLAEALNRAINQAVSGAGAGAAPQPAPAPRQAAPAEGWKCACGAENTGNFCTNCGAKRPERPKQFRCDKCGWTPADPANPPRFCPNCGDPFNAGDAV